MKIREVIAQRATIGESVFNSYDELAANKKLDKEIGDEIELADEKWAELMNNKRQAMHLKKLWNIKVAQFKQAKKDGRIEQFLNDASKRLVDKLPNNLYEK